MRKVLIIDDERTICTSLHFALEDDYQVFTANNVFELENLLEDENFDVVLLDLKFGDVSGLDLIAPIKQQNKHTAIIMMTAYASVESSIEAMKRGVYDYIIKPIDITKLTFLIQKAVDFKRLNERVSLLEKEAERRDTNPQIIGSSKKMQDIFHIIDKVKDIEMNVLIEGPSGTGKELVAREIHYRGKRKDEPFEVVNCGAIPSTLIESELFGYEKGAFTGAANKRKGLFELAHNGTLFLDEIGEMDLHAQVKLLRVLQTMEIFPLGSEKSKKIDVRIIAATNRDLKEEVKKGNFREDLYFRLNVISIGMPSLHQRIEDLPLLVEYFIKKTSTTFNLPVKSISREAYNALEQYDFPGNVRELQNIIERSVVFASNEVIDLSDLPDMISGTQIPTQKSAKIIPVSLGLTLAQVERIMIEETLAYHEGNRRKTAEQLGISERNLRYKIKQYAEED
jgi:two-component system response regulator AtoC